MIYRTIACLAFAVLIFSTCAAAAPKKPAAKAQKEDRSGNVSILSIIPAQGEPGATVTLYGGGFSPNTRAFLGRAEIAARVSSEEQISFDIPKLSPGLYALYLRREDGAASKVYNFTILPPTPVVESLSPDRVYACGGDNGQEVVVTGHNFQEKSQILFDRAAIKSRRISSEAIAFTVPQVGGGLHQVQVRNQEETISGITGLFIDAKPQISGVTVGETYVNYYELVVQGRNFQPGSLLIVDGRQVFGGASNFTDRERVTYGDCSRLVYERHPYNTTPKDLRIQVVNPNNEGSAVVQVSAP